MGLPPPTRRRDLPDPIFRSKAEVLATLGPVLTSARILPQISFTVSAWRSDPEHWIHAIKRVFVSGRLIVRSSSRSEDRLLGSRAGMFKTVSNVSPEASDLAAAVEAVIESFRKGGGADEADEVLVQPFITGRTLSGVAFSCDLRAGAPYFTVCFEESTRTNGVTSGTSPDVRTIHIHRDGEDAGIQDTRLRRLVATIRELEGLSGSRQLDVEFAFSEQGELFIFQVRVLPDHGAVSSPPLAEILSDFARVRPDLTRKVCFSDMTDWNPAEMIGVRPKPLAASLYRFLLTDETWAEARGQIGYRKMSPVPLMVLLGGHPYINVPLSFRSLLPAGLSPALGERLIDHWVSELEARPELHDKAEFEVLSTCMTPDFGRQEQRLINAGFEDSEVRDFRSALTVLTDAILAGQTPTIPSLLEELGKLDIKTRARPRPGEVAPSGHRQAILAMLEDCRSLGTLPFAILARYAFIGSAILKGLEIEGALSAIELLEFQGSYSTVAAEVTRDLRKLRLGDVSLDSFLETYGHLRPGTYDIQQARYDDRPDLYFYSSASLAPQEKIPAKSGIRADRVNFALARCGLKTSAEAFFRFARESAQARESAKFIFTRTLSDIMERIHDLGKEAGLTREDCAYLELADLSAGSWSEIPERLRGRKEEFERNQTIILPNLIFGEDDLACVSSRACRPNFVTRLSVSARPIYLENPRSVGDLGGKIVLIESADPGYDWIFSHGISGLITQYGGAASHMAIRCAEFRIPAAIGCGEDLFSRLRNANVILLDCEGQSVRGRSCE